MLRKIAFAFQVLFIPFTTAFADQVEIKIVASEHQTQKALHAFGLTMDESRKRLVFFYDTRDLTLYKKGAILRARRKDRDSEDDSTVKIRPLSPKQVDTEWFREAGFKCEGDRSHGKTIPSCSLTVEQDPHEVMAVARGERPIKKLYSKKQERFILDFAGHKDENWARLEVLGPIHSHKWKIEPPEFASPIDVELWVIEARKHVLEFSIRADSKHVVSLEKKLAKLLENHGIAASESQESKTRTALAILVKQRISTAF